MIAASRDQGLLRTSLYRPIFQAGFGIGVFIFFAMSKLLPLVYFSLLPLPAFALLENATVSAEVLPSEDDEWMAIRERDTAKLKELVEAELAKMPSLSGVYAGFIQIRAPEASADEASQNVVELLRIARLQEGDNRLQTVDEEGVFDVSMALKPDGVYWDLAGSIDYFKHGASNGHRMRISSVVPEDIAVFLASSPDQRALMAKNAVASAANTGMWENKNEAETPSDLISGYFFLRTADAPDPKLSPANPINRVTLPSGRIVQLEPGLSREAAREVLAAEMAKDADADAAE